LLQVRPDEAREVVERIQNSVDNYDYGVGVSGASIGISIGWACYGTDGHSLDELLLAADRAMYADKNRRKALAPSSSETQGRDRAHSNIM